MNERFLDAMRDCIDADVRSQAAAARSQDAPGLERCLVAGEDVAADWIRKSGPDHYREHLPRLRTWLQELRTSAGQQSQNLP